MSKYPLTYEDFKQGLLEDKLLGLKCMDCGELLLPPSAVCTSCGGSKMEVNSFAKRGKIKTFSVIRVGPAGYSTPYVVALVELHDGPWVVGNLTSFDPLKASMDLIEKEVSIGSKMLPHDPAEPGQEGCVLTFELI
ncbi:MAG: Zn-ribbon domain-containing OB-fold protein [Desulfomonilaceae bacterium]